MEVSVKQRDFHATWGSPFILFHLIFIQPTTYPFELSIMPSSKRKRSPATLHPPLITPRTTKSRLAFEAWTTSPPSHVQLRSAHPSSSVVRQLRTPFRTETQYEADYSESSIDDDLGHVILAIDIKDYGTIGCAYYSTEHEKLYLLGDSRSGGMETIDTCMFSLFEKSRDIQRH